jgi:hypothetical protein
MKTQFGNSGDGCAMVGELMRHGFPKDFIDLVAVEDLGQTFIPERPLPGSMQSAWLLRQTARVMGYPARITACYEWLGRRDQVLGLGGQAEWYLRDGLQARAYGFESIKLGPIHDAGKGYYHTLWGSGALCGRYPYMYPKPAYVALATLTRQLDGARFKRLVPTGSSTLLAPEYEGPQGPVLALWTPRGKRQATLNFAAPATVTVIDLYGRERTLQGASVDLEAGEAACFVRATEPVLSISAGKAWFPAEPPPEHPQVLVPLNDASKVSQLATPEKRLQRTSGWSLPHRTPGQFTVQTVEDAERGPCLELRLIPDKPLAWAMLHEYTVLKFAEPVTAAGPVSQVGVWVKGNGGWGEVAWELRNERGDTWLTTGVYWDWPAKLCINFDGWHFLHLSLPEKLRTGVQVTGLAITMPREVLQVTEMAPVKELSVRLSDICVY